MMRFVTVIIFIIVGYILLRYLIKTLKEVIYQRSERDGYQYQNWEHANTEEEYRQILVVTVEDSPATIRKKYDSSGFRMDRGI